VHVDECDDDADDKGRPSGLSGPWQEARPRRVYRIAHDCDGRLDRFLELAVGQNSFSACLVRAAAVCVDNPDNAKEEQQLEQNPGCRQLR